MNMKIRFRVMRTGVLATAVAATATCGAINLEKESWKVGADTARACA